MSSDPTIDRLILAGVTDGEFRKDKLVGLSRQSPFLYIGGTKTEQVTVDGYYKCPAIAQFRVAVRQVSPYPALSPRITKCPHPCSEACVALPNMLDLDTRNLYFGQLNVSPSDSAFKVGTGNGGYTVKGLPMRLQQVHFRAFHPLGQSDEYAAFFLTSNPVGPYKAKGTTVVLPAVVIDTDFELQLGDTADHLYWTQNGWTYSGSASEADHEGRLIIGDPLGVAAGQMDGDGNEVPLTWKLMYDCYDDFAGPKNQVYRMILDDEGFIIRQSQLNYDSGRGGGKGQGGNYAPGWGYEIPMDVIISNRYRFHLPDGPLSTYDHMVIEYYPGAVWEKERLLLRPPPRERTVIGCVDKTVGWEPVRMLGIREFCNLFPRIVNRIENFGSGLREHYLLLEYDDVPELGGIIVTKHQRQIIAFTDCGDDELPSTGSTPYPEPSGSETIPSSPGTSEVPLCPELESSYIPCPDRPPDDCGDCDQVC